MVDEKKINWTARLSDVSWYVALFASIIALIQGALDRKK